MERPAFWRTLSDGVAAEWDWALGMLNTDRAALWAQAIGAVGALIVAVVLWRLDRRWERKIRVRDDKEHLRRLITGLRSEVLAALERAGSRRAGLEAAVAAYDQAKISGAMVVDHGPLPPGAFDITSAMIYRQAAAEIGRLPRSVIDDVVKFYERANEFAHIAVMTTSSEEAFRNAAELIPKLSLLGAILVSKLDRLAASDFDPTADLKIDQEGLRELAKRSGFPLDELLRANGRQM